MIKRVKRNVVLYALVGLFALFSLASTGAPFSTRPIEPVAVYAFSSADFNFTTEMAAPTNWEVDELVRTAGFYINAYWREVFAANGLRYTAPTVYRASQPLRNALYIPSAHAIYYDYNFFYAQMAKHGDFAVVTILAHEWGHAVQTLLERQGRISANRYDIEKELKADCFAGAFARSESRTPRLETNDIPKAISSLIEAGDHTAISIYAKNAHGTSQKRTAAFRNGFNYGVEACACNSIATLAASR
ncbi:MAG: neutral zinc metallopeptidase [Acidobacteriota bacterium]